MFYMVHNTASKEQEREFISDMVGYSKCLWLSTSSLNRKDNVISLKNKLMQYNISFCIRFSSDKFTTEWQRLEVRIAAGCTISIILFILVIEMILRSSTEETTLMTPSMKAFMDDITVLVNTVHSAKVVWC